MRQGIAQSLIVDLEMVSYGGASEWLAGVLQKDERALHQRSGRIGV
jgi:hypothetical protein